VFDLVGDPAWLTHVPARFLSVQSA
jgi:hypothetical protein